MSEVVSCPQLYCEERVLPQSGELCVEFTPTQLAQAAVDALISEAVLSPKPALVDARGSGAHKDLTLDILIRSANSLRPCFQQIAEASANAVPEQALREELAEIGRGGEVAMYAATEGSNAHKGAIWALGLLVAGASIGHRRDPQVIACIAAEIARCSDSRQLLQLTNGVAAARKFGVGGARGEAQAGFPHVVKLGLPILKQNRRRGIPESQARLNTLMAIMSELDDTCLLHRAGMTGLITAQRGARLVLAAGGTSTPDGRHALAGLDVALLKLNASPGGSADLLAATLFLDSLMESDAVFLHSMEGSQ